MDTSDGHVPLRIDRARIRASHEARLVDWPRDPKPLTIRAAVRAVENHRKTAQVGPFVVESDEGAIVGGEGTAPTPLSYFVASIGFAVLTDLVRAFALGELEVDDLRLEIEADFPLGAKYGSEPVGVEASEVRYTVEVTSGASRDELEDAIAWAERYCHAVHTLRRPVRVTARYRVGGELISPSS
jgi:uncharacterized OsmC-like protein